MAIEEIAAKVDATHREYFEDVMAPTLSDPLVEYVGEICEGERDEFLERAYALLFPIDWPEPFGLVMIAALACGRPVNAYRQGSVPEINEKVKGFIGHGLDDAVRAAERIPRASRRRRRPLLEGHFSASCMARAYAAINQRLVQRALPANEAVTPGTSGAMRLGTSAHVMPRPCRWRPASTGRWTASRRR